MSNRTQKEGRTFYTERDYPYTPSITALGNPLREDREWLTGLLWETRVGDPTYDPMRSAPPFEKVELALKELDPFPATYNNSASWRIEGYIENFDPDKVYTPVVVDAGEVRGVGETTLKEDGTFRYDPTNPQIWSIVDNIPVTVSVGEVGGEITIMPHTIKFTILPAQPVLHDYSVEPFENVGLATDTVVAKTKISIPNYATYGDVKVSVENAEGEVNSYDLDTSSWPMPDHNLSHDIPSQYLSTGVNKVSMHARSRYLDKQSPESVAMKTVTVI